MGGGPSTASPSSIGWRAPSVTTAPSSTEQRVRGDRTVQEVASTRLHTDLHTSLTHFTKSRTKIPSKNKQWWITSPPTPPMSLANDSLLDMGASVWTAIATPAASTPPASWGFSAVTLAGGESILFGGESVNLPGLVHSKTAALWALDGRQPSFRPLADVPSRAPSPRRQHAAAPLADGAMLLVGGLGEGGRPLGEAWTAEGHARAGARFD